MVASWWSGVVKHPFPRALALRGRLHEAKVRIGPEACAAEGEAVPVEGRNDFGVTGYADRPRLASNRRGEKWARA
jgi:hypothetical protein